MARPKLSMWKYISANLYGTHVKDENGTERKVYDSDGYLYQQGTKITASAAALNNAGVSVIDDGDKGLTLASANQTNAAATVTFPDIGDAADTVVVADTAQTLTNKTLTAPVMTNPSSTFSIGTHDYGTGTDDWTLSADELLKTVHKPTNAGGAVNAIIADTAGIPYIFINGTGHTLTVTGTGSGIAIANGKTHIVMSDGTNVIALAAVSA